MRASIVAVKDSGMSFGGLVFTFFTMMMINAIIIVPVALILQEFFRSLI